MNEPRTIEVLTPAGCVISRHVGFAQLKRGDFFRILDEAGQPGPIWMALCDPYQKPMRGRKQLAIQAAEKHPARPLLRT